MIKLIAAVTAVAAALLIAACGGSDSTTTASTASRAPSSDAAVVTTGHGASGTFLVDGDGRALYLWDADHGKTSTCTGECARDWPPLTTTGKPTASGSAESSLLGTSKRADGTLEVTYAGHPLYRFAGDSSPGQINGQGSDAFGAPWWIVQPDGRAITR